MTSHSQIHSERPVPADDAEEVLQELSDRELRLAVFDRGGHVRGSRVPPGEDPAGRALTGWTTVSGSSWRGEALCAQSDPDAWFPEVGQRADVAKAICGRCPVREQCLAEALDHDVYGVWGGLTRRERARLRTTTTRLPRAA